MDNTVTLAGVLVHDPVVTKVGVEEGAISCRFTLGIHRMWKDRRTGENKNYDTFHEVVTYRALATNVRDSCRKGDAVVVVGRLNVRHGEAGSTEIVADHVALNLSAGPIPVD